MSSRNRLVVIGAGDHCRAVIDLARSTGFDPRVVVETRFVGQTEEILGEKSFLSIGSIVIDQITLDSGVTMGAGAAVVQNVGDTSTAVGVPARSIR